MESISLKDNDSIVEMTFKAQVPVNRMMGIKQEIE